VFENIIITGLVRSLVLAILAIGFSLTFGVARILNLAHTAYYMVGAFFLYTFYTILGVNHFIAMILSLVFTVFIGSCLYKFLIDRVRERESSVVLATIGLAFVFQEVFLLAFGSQYKRLPVFTVGYLEILHVKLTYQSIFVVSISIILMFLVWLFLNKTKAGIAIRAAANDRETAGLMGIDVGRACLIATGLGVALAALAGIVAAPLYLLEPLMWTSPLLGVIAIVILGGLGSIKGSIFGSFIVGYAETLVIFLIPNGAFLKETVALAIMVAVLLIRPEGLFGVVFEEERL
jgi:branched-chain amino acid transport system permease protein